MAKEQSVFNLTLTALRVNSNGSLVHCPRTCKTARRSRKRVNIRCPTLQQVRATSQFITSHAIQKANMHDIGTRLRLFLRLSDTGFSTTANLTLPRMHPNLHHDISQLLLPSSQASDVRHRGTRCCDAVVGRSDVPGQL